MANFEMEKNFKAGDIVTIGDDLTMYVVSGIRDNTTATIFGLVLTSIGDDTMVFSKDVNVNDLVFHTEYEININGPLHTVMEGVKVGEKIFVYANA